MLNSSGQFEERAPGLARSIAPGQSLLAALTLACAALAPAANATQSASNGAQPSDTTQLMVEEIIVTARKREESLQDIPVAATAISAGTLERNNMRSLAEIAALTPGLSITTDSPTRAFISIRGVGTTLIPSVQPGVGIFIDGIYQPNTSYITNPVLDIERIEVLRGPQGTLYGKNTLGGAISVISRMPRDYMEGQVSGGYTDGDNGRFAAASLSGPLIGDQLLGRIAVSSERSDGFFRNRLVSGYANPREADSLSALLRWNLSDRTSLTVSASYIDLLAGDLPYSDVAGPRDYTDNIRLNVLNRGDFTYERLNLKLESDLSDAVKLTAIAAYDARDGKIVQDGDFTSADIVRTNQRSDLETYSAEVRLDWTHSDTVSTLWGVFASDSESGGPNHTTIPSVGLTTTNIGDGRAKSYAVFATAFWDLAPDLELTAGLRYDYEDLEARTATYTSLAPDVIVTSPLATASDSDVQPRVTLTKRMQSGVMTYASVARGYRGGGTNSADAPEHLRTFKGDSVWSYELGTKMEAFDRRLALAAAIYYNDYKDYIGPSALIRGTGGRVTTTNLNSGEVESYGVELEISARLTERWSAAASGTLMHARLTNDDPYFAATGERFLTDRLFLQPDWTFNIETTYAMPLGDGDLIFRGALTGKGDRALEGENSVSVLESYFLTDASVTYDLGEVEVALFGTNLFNEKYINNYLDGETLAGLGLPYSNLADVRFGRQIGVRAKYSF